MTIDFLITELNVGGAEKMLTELAVGMHRRGHRVRVLSIGSRPTRERSGLVDRLQRDSIAVHFGGFDHWQSILAAKRWLWEHWEREPPELCQSFLFHANCLASWVAAPSGVRVLVGGLRVAESNRLRCRLEKSAVKRMSHLVCVSQKVLEFARRELDVSADRASVIGNAVDVADYQQVDEFDWHTIGWHGDAQVVLFVGRLHRQKGIEVLQNAWPLVEPSDRERFLLLVGDGPLNGDLSQWADDQADRRVRLLPWQSDIRPLLKAASVVVLPSHYEGMPNVILEAMASGKPVVCSRVEGSDELLQPGSRRDAVQGFDPGDAQALAGRITSLLDDPELANEIGGQNQRFVQQRFSTNQFIDHYESLYKTLCGEALRGENPPQS